MISLVEVNPYGRWIITPVAAAGSVDIRNKYITRLGRRRGFRRAKSCKKLGRGGSLFASRTVLPQELKRKISPGLHTMVAEHSAFLRLFGLGFSVLLLYGPVAGMPDHNGFRYLLGPWICPAIVAAYRTIVPFRPFRGTTFVEHTHDVDRTDPAVMRLVELYKSSEAVRYLWKQTMKFAAVLFVIMGFIALLTRGSLRWSFPYSLDGAAASDTARYWFWMGWIGGCLGAFIALMTDYIRWGLMTWAQREQMNVK